MKQKLLIFLLCASFMAHLLPASAATDERFQPITRTELIKQIAQTPLNSPQQSVLISRAKVSHFLDTAYNQYTMLWNKQPQNPDTNLLRGTSALLFCQDSMDLRLQPLYGLHSSRTDLFPVAASCLKTAAETNPKSADRSTHSFNAWVRLLLYSQQSIFCKASDCRTHTGSST
jgi:hypothetical protein